MPGHLEKTKIISLMSSYLRHVTPIHRFWFRLEDDSNFLRLNPFSATDLFLYHLKT